MKVALTAWQKLVKATDIYQEGNNLKAEYFVIKSHSASPSLLLFFDYPFTSHTHNTLESQNLIAFMPAIMKCWLSDSSDDEEMLICWLMKVFVPFVIISLFSQAMLAVLPSNQPCVPQARIFLQQD